MQSNIHGDLALHRHPSEGDAGFSQLHSSGLIQLFLTIRGRPDPASVRVKGKMPLDFTGSLDGVLCVQSCNCPPLPWKLPQGPLLLYCPGGTYLAVGPLLLPSGVQVILILADN